MIVDFHTHIFPDKIAEKTISILAKASNSLPHTNGTVEGLCAQVEKAKIDLAIALPVLTKPEQFDRVLRFASIVNENYYNSKSKVLSFAGIHPKCQDIAGKMKQIKELGFKGVKIHPQYQDTFIDDIGYEQILSCAKEQDLIVVTHAGVDDGYKDSPVMCPPDKTAKLIDKVNHDKFVLAHYGGNRQWEEVIKYLVGKNVYFDTSYILNYIPTDIFYEILEKHGENKILFATDSPWRDISTEVERLKKLIPQKEKQEKIFGENAKKLLNMEKL